MLKLILWPLTGIKNQRVELIGAYHNICFYALRGKVDQYDLAFAEIADGVLIPAGWISRWRHAAEQLVPNPLQAVITLFNDSLVSNDTVSIGIAEYLNRLPEAMEHNRTIDGIKEQQERDNAVAEQQLREATERTLRANREKELMKVKHEFVNGEFIRANDFIALCCYYGVVIPPRTLGWCYKALHLVSRSNYVRKNGSNRSTSIMGYIGMLRAAIR